LVLRAESKNRFNSPYCTIFCGGRGQWQDTNPIQNLFLISINLFVEIIIKLSIPSLTMNNQYMEKIPITGSNLFNFNCARQDIEMQKNEVGVFEKN
jgi:hypothetical protein